MAKQASGVEIPFWIFGQQKWVSGINKNTTCQEVLEVLFQYIGTKAEETGGVKSDNFCLVEKWRKIERPLGSSTKVLKVWQAWGEDKSEVRLVVKRGQTPVTASTPVEAPLGDTPSREVRRRKSRMIKKLDTVHPKTLLDDRAKCRDSIQKLMRIIIAQGNTISTQLAGLKEKEEAIDNFEQRMHHLRMKESGRDYLLHTYLDQLPDTTESKDTRNLEVTPRTSRKSSLRDSKDSKQSRGSPTVHPCGGVQPKEVKQWTEALDRLNKLNSDLTSKEEEILKLNQRTRSLSERQKSNKVVVPELEEILNLPVATLERELCLSRSEVETLIEAINSTMEESKKIERDLISIQERKLAGDIYINNLLSDLKNAEDEGVELQKEFDWILTLPPSAFASKEMLDWLRRDVHGDDGDTDSELGLELTCQDARTVVTGTRTRTNTGTVLLPDQVHPSPPEARSSSTGSTSSGISSDLHSLVSPEPEQDSKSSSSSSLKPPLPPKRHQTLKLPDSHGNDKYDQDEDNNSDTGLSSLNSSAEEPYTLDTLV